MAGVRPPLKGMGAGRSAWTTYAESLGIEVVPSDKVVDIIKACDEAEKETYEEAALEAEPFDPEDPVAYIQFPRGATHHSDERGFEYEINPETGFAMKRIR